MAQVLYIPGGGCEILLCGEDDFEGRKAAFERIVRERLGTDAAALFNKLMETAAGMSLEDEIKSYEATCERYCTLLCDARDELGSLAGSIEQKPTAFTKRSIVQSLRRIAANINRDL